MKKKKILFRFAAWSAAIIALCAAGSAIGPFSTEHHAQTGLVINELMSDNAACAPHNGRFSDWIEVRNVSGSALSLNGWRLISDTNSKRVYAFPDITLQDGETALVYAQGRTGVRDAQTAEFTLSPTGGTVLLLDPDFETSDEVVYPALKSGEVYARGDDGVFAVTDAFTPGMANTPFNHQAVLDERSAGGDIVIEEICADPMDGDDYIILKNLSSSRRSLSGMYLSDDRLNLTKRALTGSLDGGETLKILCGEGMFSLNADGESVYLTAADGLIASSVTWESLGKGVSMVRSGSGYAASAPDEDAGPQSEIYLSEAAVRLVGLDDFIEVTNRSAGTVDLSGYGISDDVEHPRKWTCPEGTALEPGGVYVLYLNDDKLFRLKADGSETAVLALPDGTIIDTLSTAGARTNLSVGRDPVSLRRVFYRYPTPGTENGTGGLTEFTAPVVFSREGGEVTEEKISVTLASEEGAAIYYTLDGSEPTRNSERYTEALIFSNTVRIRAVAVRDGALESEITEQTYRFE